MTATGIIAIIALVISVIAFLISVIPLLRLLFFFIKEFVIDLIDKIKEKHNEKRC